MSRIRAILFDKDGTLLDFNATWLDYIRQLAVEAAGGEEHRSVKLLETVGFDAASEAFRPGSVVAAGTSVDIIAGMYPDLSAEELRPLIRDADARAAVVASEKAVAIPGSIEALTQLHGAGFRLGIATNDATIGAEQTLLAFGIANLFDAAYGYDAVANPKPAPDVIFAFADSVGVPASEVAMVGDNLHDLECARSAGAGLAVGVLSGNSSHNDLASLADVVLPSVTDLPDYMAARRT